MRPAAPHTPTQVAAEALPAMHAGAQSVHRSMPTPDTAVAHADVIERTLAEAGITVEQVHHGDGIASWAVNRRAIRRTSRFCPTGAWPTATAISLRLPPRCSPTARLNSRAAIRRHLTA
jgi:uncharacterized protein (DUF849 family)